MAVIRDVNTILGLLERGAVMREATQGLAEMMAQMKAISDEYPKMKVKGAVNLKLAFVMKDGEVELSADLEVKKPKTPRGSQHFWVNRDGELTNEHPKQDDIFRPRDSAAAGSA